jgi:hypothetical protein
LKNTNGNELLRALKGVGQLSASAMGLMPGASFFTNFKPPLFSALPLLASGVAAAVLANAYFGLLADTPLVRARRFIIAALVCAGLYGLIFDFTTVGVPEERGESVTKYQIGFGMSDFSLTAEAKSKRDMLDLRTSQDLMLAMGGFSEGGRQKIWKEWSIAMAGALLMLLFLAAFLLWAHGIGLLARALFRPGHKPQPTKNKQPA